MAKFVVPLQDEITRLARKEVLKTQKELKKTSASLKKENTELRKRMKALEKIVSVLQKIAGGDKMIKALPSDTEVKNVKIQPRSITTMRKKHGLSGLKMAALLGINNKSLARWEKGIGTPQAESKKKILAFKNMSKLAVRKMLKELNAKKAVPAEKPTAPAKKAVKKTATKKKAAKAAAKVK